MIKKNFKDINWKEFYFSFKGRVNRKRFWLNLIVPVFLIALVLGLVDIALGLVYETQPSDGSESQEIGLLSSIFRIITIWPYLALTSKRLHDREFSGWWIAAPITAMAVAGAGFTLFSPLGYFGAFVAFGLGLWLMTQVLFLKGTDGPNEYGEDPLVLDGLCPKCAEQEANCADHDGVETVIEAEIFEVGK